MGFLTGYWVGGALAQVVENTSRMTRVAVGAEACDALGLLAAENARLHAENARLAVVAGQWRELAERLEAENAHLRDPLDSRLVGPEWDAL